MKGTNSQPCPPSESNIHLPFMMILSRVWRSHDSPQNDYLYFRLLAKSTSAFFPPPTVEICHTLAYNTLDHRLHHQKVYCDQYRLACRLQQATYPTLYAVNFQTLKPSVKGAHQGAHPEQKMKITLPTSFSRTKLSTIGSTIIVYDTTYTILAAVHFLTRASHVASEDAAQISVCILRMFF